MKAMPDDEIIDIFDDERQLIGKAARSIAHRDGLWHQTFHCWVVRRDAAGTYLLFQQRGPHKDLFPLLWDVSAAGHLASGETPADGVRELAEELGVTVNAAQLHAVGVVPSAGRWGNLIDREFCHVFVLEQARPLADYRPGVPEVAALAELELRVAARLLDGHIDTAVIQGLAWAADGSTQPLVAPIRRDDIAPRPTGYYPLLFGAVARLVATPPATNQL
jgi:isopentenyldiphosphate isomerase